MYLWEILHLTIKKMNKHVVKLGGELGEARDKLARVESSSSDSEDEDSAPQKVKKADNGDKPTEEVRQLIITFMKTIVFKIYH